MEVFCPVLPSIGDKGRTTHARDALTLSFASVDSAPSFFYIIRCPPVYFLDPDFINTYLKRPQSSVIQPKGKLNDRDVIEEDDEQLEEPEAKGENETEKDEAKNEEGFYALSIGDRIDQHNACCILPTGKMILSVDKDTYEQLGLTGKKSAFSSRLKANRFSKCLSAFTCTLRQPHTLHRSYQKDITIDLTAPSFKPGKKNYDRVRWCLTDRVSPVQMLACYYKGFPQI